MQREQRDPAFLGYLCHAQRVSMVVVPACAELQRYRNLCGRHDRLENPSDQQFVAQEGGARHRIAYLLRGASHVDVDDLRTFANVMARGVSHHSGLRARDLHGYRVRLSFVVRAPAGLLAAPQERIGCHHFGNGDARTQSLAKLPEGAVRYPGHRCHKQVVAQDVWTDLHCGAWFPEGKDFYPRSLAERKQNFSLWRQSAGAMLSCRDS
jgi:hypothetical protein